VKTNHLT